MALFLDSVDLDEIKSGMELGIYSGVTTNPLLLANIPPEDRLERLGSIAKICTNSLYLQVDRLALSEMEEQALTLVEVAPGRTVIKVPFSENGLKLCRRLRHLPLPVCLTAVFSATQAYSAAAAGAHAVAIYVGRITRGGEDGVRVVRHAAAMLSAAGMRTSLLAASIPDIETLAELLTIPGIDATIPYKLQEPLLKHPGTSEAIEQFARSARRQH
jgi:transaldolase